MPLRLLEVTLPNEALEQIPDLLEDLRVVQVWTSAATPTGFARILLDARDTEALSDALVRRFGLRESFRLVVLSVEATLPAVEEAATAEPAPSESTAPADEHPRRISREELYEDLAEGSKLTRVFALMIALSTVVAAVGLIRGDLAIVIGAMVIAPLLAPNIALSLACTLGDPRLAKRSLEAIGVGMVIAAALSSLLGAVLDVDPSVPELATRTRVGVGDIVLALAAGTAGTLAFTGGVPAVVVGVMVAVALLPPLVVAGLLAGSGHEAPALGALTLCLTNVTCVNLAAVATFLCQRVRPRTWWEAKRAKKATRIAVTTWIVMLALLLALILLGGVGEV